MSVRAAIVEQFGRPRGWLGRLAGWIMRWRPSNRRRNQWTVGLLGIRPGDRVLEIGCGPGGALKACATRAKQGLVVGLDHSATMIGQAEARLGAEIGTGRVLLRMGGLADIPGLGGRFDKAFLVNVVPFLPDLDVAYRTLFDSLAPGGAVATTYQPRHRNPSRDDALDMAGGVTAAMAAAGFVDIRIEELPLAPAVAVCVLGTRPA